MGFRFLFQPLDRPIFSILYLFPHCLFLSNTMPPFYQLLYLTRWNKCLENLVILCCHLTAICHFTCSCSERKKEMKARQHWKIQIIHSKLSQIHNGGKKLSIRKKLRTWILKEFHNLTAWWWVLSEANRNTHSVWICHHLSSPTNEATHGNRKWQSSNERMWR